MFPGPVVELGPWIWNRHVKQGKVEWQTLNKVFRDGQLNPLVEKNDQVPMFTGWERKKIRIR